MGVGTSERVCKVRGQRSRSLQHSHIRKVICVRICECCNGGGIHFDGVASRLTFLSD